MCLYADRLWLPDPLELLASVWEARVPAGIGNGQQYFSPYVRALGVHSDFIVDKRNPDYAHSTALTLSVKRRLDTGFIGAERQLESGFGREAAG